MRWGRRRFTEAWGLLFVGLAILGAAAADVGYFAVWPASATSDGPVNARYPLPAVTGVLELRDPIYGISTVAQPGGPCKGLGQYDGILGGTPVVVRDASGVVIGTGALDIGRVAQNSTCDFAFEAQVPKADGYQFEVLNRQVGAFRYDDLVARGWQVTLSLG